MSDIISFRARAWRSPGNTQCADTTVCHVWCVGRCCLDPCEVSCPSDLTAQCWSRERQHYEQHRATDSHVPVSLYGDALRLTVLCSLVSLHLNALRFEFEVYALMCPVEEVSLVFGINSTDLCSLPSLGSSALRIEFQVHALLLRGG